MRYLADLREGERIVECYLCANKQTLKTRAGKNYYSLKIQDKTSVLDAKIWDLSNDIGHFEEGDYIKIDGEVISYQNTNQINIKKVRRCEVGQYDPKDYVKTTEYNINDLYQTLLTFVGEIQNKYVKDLVSQFFVDDEKFIKAFKEHTAAKTMHHSYMGGLLEHTVSILKICRFMADTYPLNRDLLYAGALFHDIGKIQELSPMPMTEYTDEGQLLGHIIICIEWLNEKMATIPGFPKDLGNMIKHLVLSHHGELEYGSPKKPVMMEAFALHFADNMDAKLNAFMEIVKDNRDTESNWLGYQRIFDSNIRRTNI